MGAAWEVDDGVAEDEEHGLQVLADVAAEREVKALEARAERNGIAWADLPGRGRVGVKEASAEPGTRRRAYGRAAAGGGAAVGAF
jgi:hypothetical protein